MWKTTKESSILDKIEYVKSLYDTQKETVKREQYIEQLLLEDYVAQVKRNLSRYDFMASVINEAIKEVGKKLKKERTNLELLTSWISEDFCGNRKVKIFDIVHGGWENYYWCIGFELDGKTFHIEIPQLENITSENLPFANYGKFSLLIPENEVCWNTLIRSYKITDIANFIEKYKENDNGN